MNLGLVQPSGTTTRVGSAARGDTPSDLFRCWTRVLPYGAPVRTFTPAQPVITLNRFLRRNIHEQGYLLDSSSPHGWGFRAPVDYPRTQADLKTRFATEVACRAYVPSLRWQEGFHCPRCGAALLARPSPAPRPQGVGSR